MRLTIDLSALCQNYQFLCDQFTGTDIAAVVKANAYGLGADKIAPALYQHGCRHFFVATVDEALSLRSFVSDRQARISVLNGLMGRDISVFIDHDLTPVLNHITDINTYLPDASACDAILHIDTGMNRLGVSADDILAFDFKGWTPLYVMSHLACADLQTHEMNGEQLQKMHDIVAQIPSQKGGSLCNSAGLFLGDAYHFDLARPGIALYGGAIRDDYHPMQNIVTWEAEILQIRDVKKGQSIGYGATYVADVKRKIAIISCGYADGLHRILGNHGTVTLCHQKCPIIGHVSMDLTAIDITDVTSDVAIGDMVEIFGKNANISELAKQAQTIDYELLTGLGQRAQRCYLDR